MSASNSGPPTQPFGRTVIVGIGRAPYRAFVPAPLPPLLTFDAAMLRSLSNADRALGELAGVARTMSNPQLLIGPFIRRESVLSSRIEGTRTSLADLYAYEAGDLVLPGSRTPPSPDDIREVHNYVRALEYGLERLQTLPISLRLIREVHERLMRGVRGDQATPGEFRRTQNWIGPAGCTLNDATYVPPPVPEMHEALAAFEAYLHREDDYPPLVRLALIHQQFEAIHPFLDGNGRVGRLLISLLLVHWELLPAPLLYLSAFFEQHRQDYYDLLLAVNERGAWAEWITYFLRGVAEQAHDAVARAKQLQDLQNNWHERLMTARSSALTLRLANSLFTNPVLTIPQAQQLLGVTYRSAQLNVEKLVQANILHLLGDSRQSKVFAAQDILRMSRSGERAAHEREE